MILSTPAFALTDVPYTFEQTKLAAADDAFHFLRSYVDYFYLLYNANSKQLPALASFADQAGWCVGDAHPENFGVLIQENDSSIFAMNDVDDAGPCPVVLDLARLMTSTQLYDNSISTDDILKEYRHGLEGKDEKPPEPVVDMLKESAKKGERPEKSRVDPGTNKLVRDAKATEVPAAVVAQLTKAYKSLLPRHADLVDVIETSKVGGGSGGLRRYELLVKDRAGYVEIEMKQEIAPSIYPVATGLIPTFSDRMKKTWAVEQGPTASAYNSTFTIDKLNMISRPRFAGNVGVNLDKTSAKDNRDIILFEAYTLGAAHSRSVDGEKWSERLKDADFSQDIAALVGAFEQKYKSLKSN